MNEMLIRRELLERLALQRKDDGWLEMNTATVFEASKELRAILDSEPPQDWQKDYMDLHDMHAEALLDISELREKSDKQITLLEFGRAHAINARHDVEVRANNGNKAAELALAGVDQWIADVDQYLKEIKQ